MVKRAKCKLIEYESYDNAYNRKIETEKLVAYRSTNDIPSEAKKNQIYVDMKNDCIVCPIFGKMVPFHINVIKNVNKQEEDKKIAALRLNFHIPVATASTITFPVSRTLCNNSQQTVGTQ